MGAWVGAGVAAGVGAGVGVGICGGKLGGGVLGWAGMVGIGIGCGVVGAGVAWLALFGLAGGVTFGLVGLRLMVYLAGAAVGVRVTGGLLTGGNCGFACRAVGAWDVCGTGLVGGVCGVWGGVWGGAVVWACCIAR